VKFTGERKEKYCFLREKLSYGMRRLLPELLGITICHIMFIFSSSLPLSVLFVQLLLSLRLLVTVLLRLSGITFMQE